MHNQNHMAILFDEYGVLAVLLTMEDIIEEIVGEINDEFDEEEEPDVTQLDDDYYRISGQTMITEVNELLQLHIEEEDADTIGGWMMTQKYDIKEEEELFFGRYAFKINEFEGHQIKTIDVYLKPLDEENIDDE